jgi:hypothetical protein
VSPSTALGEPTEQEIEELLRDPACPHSRGLKEQVVPVLQFIAFAKSRGYATSNVESLSDRCVRRLGGARHGVVDPALWIPNLRSQAHPHLRLPSADVWLLPPRS